MLQLHFQILKHEIINFFSHKTKNVYLLKINLIGMNILIVFIT